MFYLVPVAISLLLSIIITPIIKSLALRFNIVDHPGDPRKIHNKPIPLLGGAAIFLSFAITTAVMLKMGYIIDDKISLYNIIAILAGGFILIVGGVIDDRINLRPLQQMLFPFLAIGLVLYSGIKIQFITNPLGGIIEFPFQAGIIIAGFWLLGMIYTTKLLDGLDGLVSGVTTIGAFIIFAVSLAWDSPLSGTSILALTLAGASFGFLIFNWHPAKIFLGEGGSVFCGFMLGVLSIISGSKIATTLLIMGIPILDVVWVIIRRVISGSSLAHGDSKHLHFRLLDIGLSHRQTVLFLYVTTGAFGLTSIFLHSKGKVISLGILLIFMVILAASLVTMYKKNEQK